MHIGGRCQKVYHPLPEWRIDRGRDRCITPLNGPFRGVLQALPAVPGRGP